MTKLIADIRRARRERRLPERFRPDDVRNACPGWADKTYGVFLPKRRQGKPGGYTEYFVRIGTARTAFVDIAEFAGSRAPI